MCSNKSEVYLGVRWRMMDNGHRDNASFLLSHVFFVSKPYFLFLILFLSFSYLFVLSFLILFLSLFIPLILPGFRCIGRIGGQRVSTHTQGIDCGAYKVKTVCRCMYVCGCVYVCVCV